MSSNTGAILTSTIADAHLETDPEVAPSTAADTKPVVVDIDSDESLDSDLDIDEFPESVVEEPTERPAMMNGQPLPDLRHEQTYLAALARTDYSTKSILRVTLIDFLIWPTIMQFFYVLGLNGFKYLREGSTSSGRKFGVIIKDFLNIGGVLD